MNKLWTEHAKQFVRENCGTIKDEDLAKQLSGLLCRPVSIHSVRKVRQSMGIRKRHGRGICEVVKDEM